MRPMTLRRSLTTPATSLDRAVRVPVRVAEHDLAARSTSSSSSPSANQAPSPCLIGIVSTSPVGSRGRERRVGLLDADVDVGAHELERRVPAQHAGEQPGLAQHLEAVADPEHRPARLGELAHRPHRRREAGDRAAAQVVAVREAAREHDGADVGQPLRLVPDRDRLGAEQRRAPGVRRGRRSSPGT